MLLSSSPMPTFFILLLIQGSISPFFSRSYDCVWTFGSATADGSAGLDVVVLLLVSSFSLQFVFCY